MRKAGTIPPQRWMTAPETRAVIAALTGDGAPARFVGGCVRDAILGRDVRDIDIATAEAPDRVMEMLDRAGIKAVPTGIDHGTVTAVIDPAHFEITTLRHDVETFGRHARVAFTDDWEADAARRDFTMNAVFCDADGALYDPTGGLADIEAGRVRFVGDARERIAEDVLRLLRFFRFHAWYGSGEPDAEALAACRELADRIPGLSVERVWSELRRILLAPDPAAILDLMAADAVLDHVLPEATGRARLAALVRHEEDQGLAADAIRRLAAVVAPTTDAIALAERLRLSRAEKHRLADILTPGDDVSPDLDEAAGRRAMYRLGAPLYGDLVLLGWSAAPHAGWAAQWRLATTWQPPDFPLRGADAMAQGVPKGPDVGRLLGIVEAWWLANDFAPERAACLDRLAEAARDAGF